MPCGAKGTPWEHRAKRELNIYVHTIAFLAKEPILKEASELVPKARLWRFPNRVKNPKMNTKFLFNFHNKKSLKKRTFAAK